MASSDMLGQETEMIGLQEALSTLGAGDLALGLRQLVKDSDDAKDAFLEVLSELITSEISEASLSPLPLLDEISDHGLGACDWDRVLTSYENTCPLLLACLRATLAARQGQTEQRKDQGKAEAVKSAVGVILSLIFYMAAPESFQMKNHIDTLVSWLPQWKKQMKGGRITRSAKAPSPRASKTPEQSPTKRRRTARHSSPAAQTFSPKTTTIVSSQSDETFGSSLIENMEMSVTDDDNLEETPEPSLTLLTTLKHDAESGNDLVSFSVKQEPSVDQSESMIEEFVGDLSDDHHEDLYDKTEGNFPDGETPDGNGPDPDGELVEFEESSSQPSKGKGKKCGKKANSGNGPEMKIIIKRAKRISAAQPSPETAIFTSTITPITRKPIALKATPKHSRLKHQRLIHDILNLPSHDAEIDEKRNTDEFFQDTAAIESQPVVDQPAVIPPPVALPYLVIEPQPPAQPTLPAIPPFNQHLQAAPPKRRGSAAGLRNMEIIHERYQAVLSVLGTPGLPSSISTACRHIGIGLQTLRDSRGLAELKIMSPVLYDNLLRRMTDDELAGQKMQLKTAELLAREVLAQSGANCLLARARGQLLPFVDSN